MTTIPRPSREVRGKGHTVGKLLAGREESGETNLRRFKPYPAYKDSGVEWLGEIPADWSARRLKFVAREPIKNGVGEAGAFDDLEWPRYVRITDIAGPRSLHADTFKSLPPEVARRATFAVGDLLLAAVGATFGKSYLHVQDIGPACFAGYLVRFSPSREVESSFVAYWTESAAYWVQVQSRVVQATVQNFSAAKYRNLTIPLPTIGEQRSIVAFLDRETAKIDALVAKKERVIELLQEKRTALITHAVSTGLDPRVPMRDSGVDWLGAIPSHWDVAPVYSRYEVALGKMLDEKQITREAPGRYLRNVDVQWDRVNVEDLPEMDFALWERDRYSLRPGDLLVCEGGEVGRTAVWRGEIAECFYQKAIHRARPRSEKDNPRFFYYLMYSLAKRGVFVAGGNPNTIDHLTAVKLKRYRFPFPRPEEQRAIAAFLDRETEKIDGLVAKVREAIDRLRELRSALISAAVTGKIDVRPEVPEEGRGLAAKG